MTQQKSTSAILRDLEAFIMANKQPTSVADAYKALPEVKIIEQAQYLKEHMLDRIAEKRGVDSDDYRFYYSIVESLMYMLAVMSRENQRNYEMANNKLLLQVYMGKLHFYEGELQKYTTMENLLTNETTREIINKHLQTAINK